MTDQSPLLEMNGIVKTYRAGGLFSRKKIPAVRGVDIRMPSRPSILAIVGESGRNGRPKGIFFWLAMQFMQLVRRGSAKKTCARVSNPSRNRPLTPSAFTCLSTITCGARRSTCWAYLIHRTSTLRQKRP